MEFLIGILSIYYMFFHGKCEMIFYVTKANITFDGLSILNLTLRSCFQEMSVKHSKSSFKFQVFFFVLYPLWELEQYKIHSSKNIIAYRKDNKLMEFEIRSIIISGRYQYRTILSNYMIIS